MKFIIILLLTSINIYADTLPSENSISSDQVTPKLAEDNQKLIPEDKVLPDLNLKDGLLKLNLQKSREVFQEIKHQQSGISKNVVKKIATDNSNPPPPSEVKVIPSQVATESKNNYEDKDGIRIFNRNLKYIESKSEPTITLPSGSSALATLLGGIELSKDEKVIDARLDYAFLGPNKAVVELTGCITWIRFKSDFSTERLYGVVYSVSCRAPNGKTFEVAVKGHVKDQNDEYLGAKGKLIANGKLAAAALSFLKDGTVAFGDAMAKSNTTTTVVGGGLAGNSATGQNVTGDREGYILGQTASGAAGKFLNWWVDYYTSLSPTIAVEPGRKIFISIEGEIQIPEVFFKNNENSNSRLNTDISLSLNSKGQL